MPALGANTATRDEAILGRLRRNERWKYIHYFELEGMDELYDLNADPYEMSNIIHQPGAAKILEAMKREMEQLLKAQKSRDALGRKSVP